MYCFLIYQLYFVFQQLLLKKQTIKPKLLPEDFSSIIVFKKHVKNNPQINKKSFMTENSAIQFYLYTLFKC